MLLTDNSHGATQPDSALTFLQGDGLEAEVIQTRFILELSEEQ